MIDFYLLQVLDVVGEVLLLQRLRVSI
jgi:hypothetical protein